MARMRHVRSPRRSFARAPSRALRPPLFSLSVFVLLLSALACLHSPVRAQEEPAPSAEYKDLIDQALLEFKHKNWPEARVLFRRAYELSPNARPMRGMGIVSYEMRDYVQAVRDLSAALADTRQALTEQQRSECQNLLARARTFVGVYTLKVTPPEAELSLDGARLAREPDGTLLIAFGEHVLRGMAPGHEEASARVDVQGGEQGEIELMLNPVMKPAPGLVGESTEDPSSRLHLRQAPRDQGEQRGLYGKGLRYTWVALGASALFGGGAVAAWMLGDQKLGDLDDSCKKRAMSGDPCQKGKVDTDTVTRYERLTNAAIGASGAALVAAAVLAYYEWPRERSLTVGLSPTALSLRGTF
jgi:hypothetical protein